MPKKPVYHAPTLNPETGKWDVRVTDGANGEVIETKTGFDSKNDGHDWSLKKAIQSTTKDAADNLPPRRGRSTLSL